MYNNIPSRCVVRSSIELNKQANIRLEKNRWLRTIRLSFLFWICMCCYCITLSRTRSYGPVYNMSVWCLKWTLRWRVRVQPLVQCCPCITILCWWVTHWHLHYSYSFIHFVTYSFNPVFNWAYLAWAWKKKNNIFIEHSFIGSNRLSPGVLSHFSNSIYIHTYLH
jgi:hypothetical protein